MNIRIAFRYVRNDAGDNPTDDDFFYGDFCVFCGEDFEPLLQWKKDCGNHEYTALRGEAYARLLRLMSEISAARERFDEDGCFDEKGFPIYLLDIPNDSYHGNDWDIFCAKIEMQPIFFSNGWTMELEISAEED